MPTSSAARLEQPTHTHAQRNTPKPHPHTHAQNESGAAAQLMGLLTRRRTSSTPATGIAAAAAAAAGLLAAGGGSHGSSHAATAPSSGAATPPSRRRSSSSTEVPVAGAGAAGAHQQQQRAGQQQPQHTSPHGALLWGSLKQKMGLPEGPVHASVRQLPHQPAKSVQVGLLPAQERAFGGAALRFVLLAVGVRALLPLLLLLLRSAQPQCACPARVLGVPPCAAPHPHRRRRTRAACAAWSLSTRGTSWPRVAWTARCKPGTSTSARTWPRSRRVCACARVCAPGACAGCVPKCVLVCGELWCWLVTVAGAGAAGHSTTTPARVRRPVTATRALRCCVCHTRRRRHTNCTPGRHGQRERRGIHLGRAAAAGRRRRQAAARVERSHGAGRAHAHGSHKCGGLRLLQPPGRGKRCVSGRGPLHQGVGACARGRGATGASRHARRGAAAPCVQPRPRCSRVWSATRAPCRCSPSRAHQVWDLVRGYAARSVPCAKMPTALTLTVDGQTLITGVATGGAPLACCWCASRCGSRAVLCCAVLRCAAPRCTVLCCAALCCAALRCAVLCCAVLMSWRCHGNVVVLLVLRLSPRLQVTWMARCASGTCAPRVRAASPWQRCAP
jgi:hypothetical protein